jgi:uncharacterized protein YecE (DUF72 family)
MSQILIGTSGYSYTDWVGPVYPEGTSQNDFLSMYAALFSTVELNFSYYRMPTAAQLDTFVQKTPSSFQFSIKAHQSLTHEIVASSWRDAAATFMLALEPLRREDRLAAVLLQFPFSFHYEVENRKYLNDVLVALAGLPLVVEFRCADWFNNRVIDAFRERRIAFASMDMPSLKGLPPVMDVVTGSPTYIRFHGRNEKAWWQSESAERYNYLYTDLELETWTDRVKAIAEKADRTLVYFNNHPKGQAVRNAQTFSAMLSRSGLLP